MLEEVWSLKQIYPAGKREDIIWLGKELLRVYREQYGSGLQNPSVLEGILDSQDTDPDLGLEYSRLFQQFKQIHLKPITGVDTKQFALEGVILHFADFATWALIVTEPSP